jgi:DNA polymerase II small subunit
LELTEEQQGVISELFSHGVLVTPSILEKVQQGAQVDEFITAKVASDKVVVVESYKDVHKKLTFQDFTGLFSARYNVLSNIILKNHNLPNMISAKNALYKQDKDSISLIGLITEQRISTNGHLMITLEDLTGEIKVLVNKNRTELFSFAQSLFLDGCIGVTGKCGDRIIFADNVVLPDIPDAPIKKLSKKKKIAFTSDFHYGSKHFYKKEFKAFISWLSADPVDYLFLLGDLVEGVGVYPGQEKDLNVTNLLEQYSKFARHLKKISPKTQIIICPGNHDAVRLAEPQPAFNKEYCMPLFDLPNVTLMTSPGVVEVEGVKVLMYHGYSFPYYANEVEVIRQAGGMKRSDIIMEALLKHRHLAPTYASTQMLPDSMKDPLVISTVPDFFVSGHIHTTTKHQYKSVTCLNCSAWVGMTEYQKKIGLVPDPCKVFIVDLSTREVVEKSFME